MRTFLLLLCASAVAAGCGSDSATTPKPEPQAARPKPAVADRAVPGDRFFGFPASGPAEVRTDPGELSADLPGFYADPEAAVAALRRDGFVAGVGRTFKSQDGPDVAIAAVVQMRDERGATAEFDRELDSLEHLPCPPGLKCRQETKRFAVPGVPNAAGLNTTLTVKGQPGSLHPDVLRSDAVVFRDGAFVQQVFLGTERPPAHRSALIAAVRRLAKR